MLFTNENNILKEKFISESESEVEWQIRDEDATAAPHYTIPKKATKPGVSIWDLALSIWPLEDRPESMTDPAVVNTMNLQTLFSFKEHYELLQKREGKGESSFGSDRKLPAKKFKEQDDDAGSQLHAVRFERGPITEVPDYWQHMPLKRTPTYRHLPLEHAGLASQINECVLTRAHDRSLPLRLRMFAKGNQTKKGFIIKEGDGKEPAESWDYPK